MKLFKYFSNPITLVKMNTNSKMVSKLFAIIVILFFGLSTTFAQPGVLDLVFKTFDNSSNGVEQLSATVEQNETYKIVLLNDKGQKFEKAIRPTNQLSKVYFNVPSGIYKVLVLNSTTGYIERYSARL